MVGRVYIVMDSLWGRVTDENIQRAAKLHTVQEKTWQEPEGPQVGFTLCVLICSIGSITNGTAKATDQKSFMADYFEVQVEAALCPRFRTAQVLLGVVIPRHVKERYIQNRDQVFKIFVGHIAATQDQLYMLKLPAGCESIHPIKNLVADCQNFHCL